MSRNNGEILNTVRFSEEVTAYETTVHLSFLKSEKRTLWFTDDDFTIIMRNRNKSIRRFRQGEPESHLHSSIGLEYSQTREHTEQYKIVRETVISAVITEQNKVKQRQCLDEEPDLSEASRFFSRWSTQKAVERAEKLRRELL